MGCRLAVAGGIGLLLATVLQARPETGTPAPFPLLTAPHWVAAAGILATQLGAVVLAVGWQHHPSEHGRAPAALYGVAGGMLIVSSATLAIEYVGRPHLWHGPQSYQVSGALFPAILVALTHSCRLKWAASVAAATYVLATVSVIWIVQAIPAPTPTDGPARLVPPPFPVLLIVPALLVDGIARPWIRAAFPARNLVFGLAVGIVFTGLLLLAHWPFADFLLSPAARHPFFAADRWPYHAPPGDWRWQYWSLAPGTRPFVAGMGLAALLASASAIVGAWVGRRLSRLR